MKKLDVLYTTNQKYRNIMLASILSVIKNSGMEELDIHIITSGFQKEDYKVVEEILGKYPNVKVHYYPMEEFDISSFGIPDFRNTQVANARLFFQSIMKEKMKKMDNLLYLDADTIVKGDLNDLSTYRECTIAAVRDNIKKSTALTRGSAVYYNSGVLFINVEKWIEEGREQDIIEETLRPHRNLKFPDQDILNLAFQGKITDLHPKYNVTPYEFLFRDKERKLFFDKRCQRTLEEIEESRKDPKIIHACGLGSIKPWTDNSINPFNEDYREFLRMIEEDYPLDDLNKFQQFLNDHPSFTRKMVLYRTFFPDSLNELLSKVSIRLQGRESTQKCKKM